MRNQILILAGVFITGCATQPPPMPTVNTSTPLNVSSAALVFDAPVTLAEAPLDISRSDRGAAAFWGYEQQSTSAYDIFTYNRQSTDRGDRYVQDSFTEKTGTIQR